MQYWILTFGWSLAKWRLNPNLLSDYKEHNEYKVFCQIPCLFECFVDVIGDLNSNEIFFENITWHNKMLMVYGAMHLLRSLFYAPAW